MPHRCSALGEGQHGLWGICRLLGLRGIARDDVCQLLFLVRNPDINLFQNATIVEPLACFLKSFNLCSDLRYVLGREQTRRR
jgi:hypothetical protein